MNIIKIILLLSALSITNYGIGATLQDCQYVQSIVQKECNKINKTCTIYIDKDDNTINAHSYVGYKIVYSAEMVRQFNKYELLAVALHEVGHIKNKDIETLNSFERNNKELITNKQVRHSMEYKADKYATEYFINNNCMPNYTVDVLHKIKRADWERESITHPSVSNRIKYTNYIYNIKCNKL